MKKIFPVFAVLALLAIAGAARGESPDAGPAYTLQHMTILDRFTADAELQKLRTLGYDAYLAEYTTQTGKIIYKLRSGKYPSRPEAAAAAEKYSTREGASVMIVTSRDAGEAAKPAAAPREEAPGKTGVRITVKGGDNGSRPATLQEKVNALKRGEIPQAKRAKKSDDDTWFTVQTSTEPVKRAAEHRINQLRDKGYDAYCIESVQSGRTLYKIRFGKFASADEASRAAENFSGSERRKCMVVKMATGKDVELAQPAPASDRSQADLQQEKAAAKQPAAALQAPASQPEEAPEDLDSRAEKAAGPAQPPGDSDQAASEPQMAEKPAQGEREAETAGEQPAESVQQPDAAAEPERVSKIYAYREKSGALNLTNRYEDIPEPLRTSIDYISLFPVRIKNLSKTGTVLTLDVVGEKKEIVLGGITFSKQSDAARAYLESLHNKPLRLKYNPWLKYKDGAIAGRLYRKEGSFVNLDMVRKGLGQYDAATLAPDQQEAFRQAQEAAKRDHAGMWK